MSDCNCTETMISSDCKPEAEKVAKVLTVLSEQGITTFSQQPHRLYIPQM